MVRRFSVNNALYSGTFSLSKGRKSGVIFFTCDKYNSQTFSEEILHHEFFSILLHIYKRSNFSLNEQEWSSISNIKYAHSRDIIAQASTSLRSMNYNHLRFAAGFLSDYSTTDFENDFNIFTQKLMTDPDGVIRTTVNEKINKKLNMVIDFYDRINADLNLD